MYKKRLAKIANHYTSGKQNRCTDIQSSEHTATQLYIAKLQI